MVKTRKIKVKSIENVISLQSVAILATSHLVGSIES